MTSSVVFGVIILMWAVVLVPMWLRRHDETEETRSVDTFSKAMHTLSRREAAAREKKYGLIPTRTRNHEVHVSGASADGQRPVQRRRSTTVTSRTVAERRRRTFTGLLCIAVLTLMLAVLMGGKALWGLQVLLDITLVSFMVHLRKLARHAALIRPSRARPAARDVDAYDADDDVDYRVEEFDEPMAVKLARSGRSVFDQDITFEAPAPRHAASGTGAAAVYDEDYADSDWPTFSAHGLAAPKEPAEIVFDQAEDYEPVRATRRPRYDDQGRDLEIDIPLGSEPERTARVGRPAASDIGTRPWEPVPVPKPMYATKPAAPPRSKPAPTMDPVLPPLDSDELSSSDDLEEILDRRWAVND